MGLVQGFLPFIVFALLGERAGPFWAAAAATLVAAGLALRGRAQGRSAKLLELGTLVLFAALAAWCWAAGGALPLFTARLVVDGGLLAITLLSLALGQPFTLQYAREQVPEAWWTHPGFLRVNRVITAVWALAFAIMVAADAAPLLIPGFPPLAAAAAIVVALAGAIGFTIWYPRAQRAAAAKG